MGTWGDGIFDNDSACDLAYEVAENGGVAAVEEALDKVLSSGDRYLWGFEADHALAAADIVARLLGSFGQQNAHTVGVDAWAKSFPAKVSPVLVEKALRATERVLAEHSRALAEEDEDPAEFDGWRREVRALIERLQPFAPPGVAIAVPDYGGRRSGGKSREVQVLVNRPSPFLSPVAIAAREHGGRHTNTNESHSRRKDAKGIDRRLAPALFAGASVGTAVVAAGMSLALPWQSALSNMALIVAISFVVFCAGTLVLGTLCWWLVRHPGRHLQWVIPAALTAVVIRIADAFIGPANAIWPLSNPTYSAGERAGHAIAGGEPTSHGWFMLLLAASTYLLALGAAVLTARWAFYGRLWGETAAPDSSGPSTPA